MSFDESKVARGGNPANPGEFSSKDDTRDDAGQVDAFGDTGIGDGEVWTEESSSTLGDYSLGAESSVRFTWPQDDGTTLQVTETRGIAARVEPGEDFPRGGDSITLDDGTDIPFTRDLEPQEHDAVLRQVERLHSEGRNDEAIALSPAYHELVQTEYMRLDADGEELDSVYDNEEQQTLSAYSMADQQAYNEYSLKSLRKENYSPEFFFRR